MKEEKICLGIDVSKKSLDCCLFNGTDKNKLKFNENKYTTAKKIIKKFKLKPKECFVVMEATGIYHTNIFHGFHDLGFSVSIINPTRIKNFTKMKMFRAKTDSFDSYAIAYYGFEQKPSKTIPKSKEQETIVLYLKMIEDLNFNITSMKSQVEALESNFFTTKDMIQIWKSLIKNSIKQKDKLKDKIKILVKKHFKSIYEKAISIPGIGELMTAVIIGYYGDFSNFSNAKKLVSFSGINPSPNESGSSLKSKGSISRKGNRFIRKMIYLCALSASRHNDNCKNLYLRILAKGKSKKQGLIAVANKLLRQLFGVIRSNKNFDPNYSIKR